MTNSENWICLGFIVAVMAVLIVMDCFFPVLRDLSPPVAGQPSPGRRSYSLGRVQMAFWSSIVLGALLSRLHFPDATLDLDPSLIILIGISGATCVVALAPDALKDQQAANGKAAFDGTAATIKNIDAQIMNILTNPSLTKSPQTSRPLLTKLYAQRNEQMAEMQEQIQTVQHNRRTARSTGILSDLLIDENGNSLHRLQLVAFHLYFGGVVISHFAAQHDLKITLSGSVLQLLGVSGGIYVGFKIPGK